MNDDEENENENEGRYEVGIPTLRKVNAAVWYLLK